MTAPLSASDFQAETGASDEQMTRLQTYLDLLIEWRPRISLVSASSLADPWRRHMFDSAQLLPLLPPDAKCLADLGSGAGFPGLVLAILGVEEVHLIESDGRKCEFLDIVSRETSAPVTIHRDRAESLPGLGADVVTARAVAPCRRLLPMVERHLAPGGTGFLLKGRSVEDELTQCSKTWKMQINRIQSRSDPTGRILDITGLATKGRNAKTR